jgi:hypothetical protein
MPLLTSIPYPDANSVVMSLLADLGPVAMRVPNDFQSPLIVVRRIGGQPDHEDITDFPIVLVSVFGSTYPEAQDLFGKVQTRILSSPMTAVAVLDFSSGSPGRVTGRVLVDSAGIHVGETELPGQWPDDRRLNGTYQLGWRRQFVSLG